MKVQGNVKLVVLRSTYKIENHTLYPTELTLVDETGQPVYAVEKIGWSRPVHVHITFAHVRNQPLDKTMPYPSMQSIGAVSDYNLIVSYPR